MQQKQKATLSEVIRETSIENPQAFLISLTSSFYYELVSVWLKKFLEKDCINFSIDQPAKICREQELASENSSLKAEIEKLKADLKQKKNAYSELVRKHTKESQKGIHEYEEQIRHLNRQLQKQKKTNCSLQKKVSEPPCITDNLKEDDSTEKDNCKTDMDLSIFADKKILFLGGSAGLVNKLKEKFNNAYFRDKNSSSFPDNIDITVILAKNIGHSLTNRFQSQNRCSLVIESYYTNVNMIISQMLKVSA